MRMSTVMYVVAVKPITTYDHDTISDELWSVND